MRGRYYIGSLGDAATALPPAPDSPQFLRWFGRSKVVDRRGQPLVVWHGSKRAGFDRFYFNGEREVGPHFGTYEAAREFVPYQVIDRGGQIAEHVRPFYLSIQNPIKLADAVNRWTDGIGFVNDDRLTAEEVESGDPYFLGQGVLMQLVKKRLLTAAKARAVSVGFLARPREYKPEDRGPYLATILRALGHDGVVYKNEVEDIGSISWIIFDPWQVKSVFNKGSFSPDDPDVFAGLRPRGRD